LLEDNDQGDKREKEKKKKSKHQQDAESIAMPSTEQGIKKTKTKTAKAEKAKAKTENKAQKNVEAKGKEKEKTHSTANMPVSAIPTITKVAATNVSTNGVKDMATLSETKKIAITTTSKTPAKPDDLTLIEGIGAKIAEVLSKNGVTTFKQLSLLAPDSIKDILQRNRLQLADPTTWAEQAHLAANDKMEQLETLKKELKRGKRT
jgi:predicted flap endonuclease-1-like 5' DNA nuclease